MSCLKRVVNALTKQPGVVEVSSNITEDKNEIVVVIVPAQINTVRIARIAEEALESDPRNTAPVKVTID